MHNKTNNSKGLQQHRLLGDHASSATYLTQVDIQDFEDYGERELCCVECEEPLGGKHVGLNPVGLQVLVEVGDDFLEVGEREESRERGRWEGGRV